MRTKSIFTGSCCAIVTPFDKNGKVNFDTLEKLVEFQIEGKTDAICVCGTTGEAPTLADDEHLKVIECVVKKVNGRIPVIAGTGSNDTNHAIMMSKEATLLGADALLLVTPYYNKTTQKGLIRHYTAIADTLEIPAILYNVPGRTSVNIAPSTLKALCEHPNIAAIKEASGNMAQVVEMMSLCGDKIDFYSGNDDINVPITAIGGKGAISVLANIAPTKTHQMLQLAMDGNIKEATKLQFEATELIGALFCEVNPIPVKEGLNILGFDVGIGRLPLCEMDSSNAQKLRTCMQNYGLIK